MPSPLLAHWALDPAVRFLNHGSFGACPRAVLSAQSVLREALEANPVRFLDRELPAALDAAREALAEFVGASADDLVFVPNATTGVATVLRSLPLAPGDEIVLTDHAYGATRNAAEAIAAERGARVVVAAVPLPLDDAATVVGSVMSRVGSRTRLVILDHVTSATALIFPVRRLVEALAEVAGADGTAPDLLVDGAHGPGMLPLPLTELGAAYYTGNCHKWLCAPKGAAFLWARPDRQAALRPLAVSHGWSERRSGRSRFHDLFDWTGTTDPTPLLCVPVAIATLDALDDRGWTGVRAHNDALARHGRQLLLEALAPFGVAPPAPPALLGSMAVVELTPGDAESLRAALAARGFEVPVRAWAGGRRLLRVSAQLYNDESDYAALVEALMELLPAGR